MADELGVPFEQISLEILYRGLYHFGVARSKGLASQPVTYFAAKENQDLGVLKTMRKPLTKPDLRPFLTGGSGRKTGDGQCLWLPV